MQLFTIIWTLVCAAIIIGYPLYLFNRPFAPNVMHKENEKGHSNTVELLSIDITKQLPGWSFTLDVPQITEEVLNNNPILFYLESKEACLKLPLNNTEMGYTANVYKNVGKVYVTFKSLNDGVTNFYVPAWHLSKLKILIIKSNDKKIYGNWSIKSEKSLIHRNLKRAGINWNSYEDILGYLSNIAAIDFKGHFVAPSPKRPGYRTKGSPLSSNEQKLISTG